MVPVRLEVVLFGATVKLSIPGPEPLVPAVSVIHAALLAAVQVQPVLAVIVTVALPPAAGTD
jgi:hypothetical protein